MKLLIIFIVLNIVNVIMQTMKSIVTVKATKGIAAFVNAIAFGLYTVVTVYLMCELPLVLKATIVALCNLVGVYVVKLIEEKARKDKLWKIECTVKKWDNILLVEQLNKADLSFNYFPTNDKDYNIFNIYCKTQKESLMAKEILKIYRAKYFVSETKTL